MENKLHDHCTVIGNKLHYHCTVISNKLHDHCTVIGNKLHDHCTVLLVINFTLTLAIISDNDRCSIDFVYTYIGVTV